MDISKLIGMIKQVASTVVPGASGAIEAAEAVVDFATGIAPTLAAVDQKALQEALEPLLAKMNRDVDQAIADLKGN